MLEFSVGNYADDLMRGDIISISFDAGSLMAIVTSGLITSGISKFRVINVTRNTDYTSTITARMCNS